MFYWIYATKHTLEKKDTSQIYNQLLDYRICILLPMRNESNNAKRKLNEVVDEIKYFNNAEIIIADSYSSDNTQKIVKETLHDPELDNNRWQILHSKEPGKSIAINQALDIIDQDIIIMMDADSSLEKGWLNTIINSFQNSEIGLISGIEVMNVSEPINLESEYKKYSNSIRLKESIIDSCFVIEGSIAAWRYSITSEFRLKEDSNADDCQLACQTVRNGLKSMIIDDLKFWNHDKLFENKFTRSLRRAQGLSRTLLRNYSLIFNKKRPKSRFIFLFNLYFYTIYPYVIFSLLGNSLLTSMIFDHNNNYWPYIYLFLFIILPLSKFGQSLLRGSIIIILSHILLVFGVKFSSWNNKFKIDN